jgi:hypothetical protein
MITPAIYPRMRYQQDREHSADIGWLCQFDVESLLWQAFTGSDGTYVASNK